MPLAALELRVVRRMVVVAELDGRAAREAEELIRAVPVHALREPPPHRARQDRAALHHLGVRPSQDHAAVVPPLRRAPRRALQQPRALATTGGAAEQELEGAGLVVVPVGHHVREQLLRVRHLGAEPVAEEAELGELELALLLAPAGELLGEVPKPQFRGRSHRRSFAASSGSPSSSSPSSSRTRLSSAANSSLTWN